MEQKLPAATGAPAAAPAEADISAALAAALQRHTGQAGQIVDMRRLSGGATKETRAFDYATADARWPLILQRLPAPPTPASIPNGAPRSPKLSAEEDAGVMIAARAHGVPAPVVRAVLDSDDGLGRGYITERIDGETLGSRIARDAGFASARALMGKQAGEILAAIHSMPTHDLGFLARVNPAQELQIAWSLIEPFGLHHPALEYALRWVRENLPKQWRTTVVHADFRTGNLIVGDDGIRCVLDWEIARIGDPMLDLGVLCMRSWRFGGAGAAGGFGSREELYAAYERASGISIDAAHVRFWEAFSNLKWAISCVRRGMSTSDDGKPTSIELSAIGRRLEEPLWDFFELIEGN
ncbi:MAG: phosphotransferase family protein [Janthinobacterium lividum]